MREKTARPGFAGGDEAGVRCRQGVGGSTHIFYHSVKKNSVTSNRPAFKVESITNTMYLKYKSFYIIIEYYIIVFLLVNRQHVRAF